MYEARNQFYNNKLFSYFDGFDVLFFDQCVRQYQQANPDAKVEDRIGYAYLLDDQGNLPVYPNGNSWSEYIFNADIQQPVLDRFLTVYDWLISEDGVKLNFFGREGVDYKYDGDTLVSTRAIDPTTGSVVPFNKDATIPDYLSPLFPAAMSDSRVGFLNPAYSDFAKNTVRYYWDLRKNAPNLKVYPFDLSLTLFTGDYFAKYDPTVPGKAIAKIIFEQPMDGIQAAWDAFLADNAAQIDNILGELNAGR